MSGLGLALGARLLPVRAFLSKIPAWAWIALAIALVALLGLWAHHHAVKKHDAALRIAVTAEVEAKSKKLIDGLNARNAQLSAELRRKNDEENSRIAAGAAALRVSGPGKAQCRPGLSSPAGQHVAASGNRDAARPQVPPDDFAAVPWGWLVGRAEEHDLDRAEVLSWREWYQKQSEAWPKRP